MSAGAGLEVRALSAGYGGQPVLHEIDFSVGPGEFVALAGPNGSGKSTLLRCVAGLLRPEAGTVAYGGVPLLERPLRERARCVAWMPQEELRGEDLSVREYVSLGRNPYHTLFAPDTPEDERAVETALAAVDLASLADRGVLSLSGGERQRARFARILAQETPVLLLDEPTAYLDIGHQLDLLRRAHDLLARERKIVLWAVHDLNLAARYADRIVVLHRGRRVADGGPEEVLRPSLLEEVWGVVAELRRDGRTGLPYLVPELPRSSERPRGDLRRGPVHVVGGGGAARPLFARLLAEGFSVTAGVLPLMDSDAEEAARLGIPAAWEIPFSPVGERAREQNCRILERAAAVVVAPAPVGPGNLSNLEDAAHCVGRVPVVLWSPPENPTEDRDFTEGRATEQVRLMTAAGAVVARSVEEVLEALRRAVPPPSSERTAIGARGPPSEEAPDPRNG